MAKQSLKRSVLVSTPTPQQWELFQSQVGTYTQFSGIMTAVTLFFTGLIITNFNDFNLSIRVPIGLLIISIFGFLYGTLIYSNATEEVTKYNYTGFRKAIYLGDIISEYLGLYFLVLSIPLVFNMVTDDIFLRTITILAALGGLMIYQFSGFSIIERHFGAKHRGIATVTILIGLLLSVTQLFANDYFMPLAVFLVMYIAAVSLVATQRIPKN